MPSARASGSATGAIIRMQTTLSMNIDRMPVSIDSTRTSSPGLPAGQFQRLHRQPARHAGLSEIAGDDPDADQDRHHVPVDELGRLDLGHGAHPDHDRDAEQRRDGGVELVDDDGRDRHRKNEQRQPLQQYSCNASPS